MVGPGFFPARLLKGEILAAKREWNDALAEFDQIIAQEPNAELAHYYKGLVLFSKGEMQVAKSSLNKAIELNAGDNRARILLADISLRLRDVDSAMRLSHEVIEKSPDNYPAHSILGRAYLVKGQFAQAEEIFRRMIALQPENPQGFFQLGIVQRLIKDDDGALVSFGKALAINPQLMDVFSQVVSIHVTKKDYAGALAQCDRQIDLLKESNRHVAMITSLKGLVYLAQKMDRKAEEEFKTAIDTYENYTQPYYELAAIYMKKNELDQAIGQYNAALEQNPDQPRAHMLLGMLYDMQQKSDLSEQHYRDALKIDPQFVPAANNLAYLLAEKGADLNEALELARRAKEKMPYDPGVMDTLGWVFYKKGLYDSAIAELNDCVEKMKDDATVHYHLGMAYFKAGKGAKAKAALEKTMALDPQFGKADEVREILGKL